MGVNLYESLTVICDDKNQISEAAKWKTKPKNKGYLDPRRSPGRMSTMRYSPLDILMTNII